MSGRCALRALTLIQPWAHAIAWCGKPVENRTWAPPPTLVGSYLAIHAGMKLDREAFEDLVIRRSGRSPAEVIGAKITIQGKPITRGAIVAVVRVDGWMRGSGGITGERLTAVHGIERERAEEILRGEWWCGPIGWVLGDVVALPEPVPCKGAQGLWTVSGSALERTRELWLEARK